MSRPKGKAITKDASVAETALERQSRERYFANHGTDIPALEERRADLDTWVSERNYRLGIMKRPTSANPGIENHIAEGSGAWVFIWKMVRGGCSQARIVQLFAGKYTRSAVVDVWKAIKTTEKADA